MMLSLQADHIPWGDTISGEEVLIPMRNAAPPVPEVTSADIFGAESYIPDIAAHMDYGYSILTDNIIFKIFALVVFVLFFVLIFRYTAELTLFIRSVWMKSRDKSNRHDGEVTRPEVRVIIMVCGLIALGIAVVRGAELWMPSELVRSMPSFAAPLTVALVGILTFVIILIQRGVLYLIGSLTFTSDFMRVLMMKRKSFFASITMVVTPLVLLAAFAPANVANVLMILYVFLIVVHAVWYAVRSFLLFVEQKVPILLWILYLCAVEVMPIGILITGMLRNIPLLTL